ncbi:hypothetical protein A4R44_01281 [Amycolatopsis sp. M39]|uniref:Uncharacterized protein n=1 Tax=Amycolatopsis rubida TaxID=112413 RepID=A0A1I5G0F2_9PSEU|nr:hypothetical protein A4R44_01281 [Amycolatopsis sp. M39]SFO29515.1 hypothetical protein SAMN05421854_1011379 [Amycolatopsis rubida]
MLQLPRRSSLTVHRDVSPHSNRSANEPSPPPRPALERSACTRQSTCGPSRRIWFSGSSSEATCRSSSRRSGRSRVRYKASAILGRSSGQAFAANVLADSQVKKARTPTPARVATVATIAATCTEVPVETPPLRRPSRAWTQASAPSGTDDDVSGLGGLEQHGCLAFNSKRHLNAVTGRQRRRAARCWWGHRAALTPSRHATRTPKKAARRPTHQERPPRQVLARAQKGDIDIARLPRAARRRQRRRGS